MLNTLQQESNSAVQSDKPLICADCEFSSISHYDWQNSRCFAPQNLKEKKINLITGQPDNIYYYPFCAQAREDVIVSIEHPCIKLKSCGQRATWFKQKEVKTIAVKADMSSQKKISLKDVTADDL